MFWARGTVSTRNFSLARRPIKLQRQLFERNYSTRTPPSPPKLKLFRFVVKPLVYTVGSGGTVYVIDNYLGSSLITRSVRALYVFLSIAYDYSIGLSSYPDVNVLHQKAADQLLDLLMTNKGIYIKFGQAIANQGSIFPMAFQRNFIKLYDDASVDKWSDVDAVLRNNLGQNYETELFDFIDHSPIASASIAQVHRAKLKSTGELVAVKAQHDYIKKQIGADLFVYRLSSKVYEKVFDMPFSFFTTYVSDQLIKEIDFIHELANAEKLRKFIENDRDTKHLNVYIPKNYKDLSTKQVLISEWIDGVSLTQKERLLDRNFDLGVLMNQYLKIFGKQLFSYGFIHSDPHPGNLLVRFIGKKQQLVILDHGLYVELPEKFKLEYAELWKFLFSFDQAGVRKIGESWGIQGVDLFSALVQLRPMLTEAEAKDFKDDRNFHELLKDFLSDERKFPLELIFLSRTMRMIQNLNQNFGSPCNRVNILTIEAVSSLVSSTSRDKNLPIARKIGELLGLLRVQISLFTSNLIFYFIRLRQLLRGDRYGGKGEGLEDYVERYMKNTMKSYGYEVM